MNQLLKVGQKLRSDSSKVEFEVDRFLGGGGQGEVYSVRLGSKSLALKWYYQAQATPQQRSALAILVDKGPPNDRFLWPLELVFAGSTTGFGYLMPLRPDSYKGIVDLMKRRAEPSFRALCKAGFDLSDSFLQLHSKGLCYRDISFGNVFFDPVNGDVLICDNDNVGVDGEVEGGILGTPRFMAPEVVRGEALPTSSTDLYSLSVLLFYIFMVHHPLEGKKESTIKCFDLPAMTKLYGTEPVFIFDPSDSSNEPDPRYHGNAIEYWRLYPKFFRDIFTRAFTAGIVDIHARVRESEWRAVMARIRDSIFYCGSCKSENFYDEEALKLSVGGSSNCWSCGKPMTLPPRIRIGKNTIMLNYDAELYPHHVNSERRYDFSSPVAAVSQHPTDSTIWGLKNHSDEKWVATLADGTTKDVEPGRNLTLATGTKINFGKSDGLIRF